MDVAADVFPSNSFYGGKNKRKLACIKRALEGTVQRNRNQKIPKSFKARLTGPSYHWRSFYKLKDAFNYSRSKATDLHVFAYESEVLGRGKGQRMYLVTSYPVFWHYYSQLESAQKHHYEVIPEGAVCKLYFDLEFLKDMNVAKNGSKMVELFIQYICLWIKYKYGVQCSKTDVLNLDASTDSKFSRHLVFLMENVVFCDNIHAGNFVSSVLEHLVKWLEHAELHQNKKVENILSEDVLVSSFERETNFVQCDGKTTNEKTHDCEKMTCAHESNSIANTKNMKNTEELVHFPTEMDSVISGHNVPKDGVDDEISKAVFNYFSLEELQSFFVYGKDGEKTLFCDTGVYNKNRNFRLYLSNKLGKDNPLVCAESGHVGESMNCNGLSEEDIFMKSLITNVEYTAKICVLTFGKAGRPMELCSTFDEKSMKQQDSENFVDGNTGSPYPEIDNFITIHIHKDGTSGSIRHWTYFSQGELIVYEISNYRYCHNIGRQHKSNNIMLIADLCRGVYYQKCHDSDCRRQNFKSEEFPLPKEVLPSHFFDGDDSFDEDDNAIIDAANEMEFNYKLDERESQNHNGSHNELNDMEDESLISAVDELEKSLQEAN
ncbi:hypothetical protein ScPMuIL_003722 [Solemya velum]